MIHGVPLCIIKLLKLDRERRVKSLNVMTVVLIWYSFTVSLQFASAKYGYSEESLLSVILGFAEYGLISLIAWQRSARQMV